MLIFFRKLLSLLVLLQISMPAVSHAEAPLIDLKKLAPSVAKRFVEFGVDQYTSLEQFKLSCVGNPDPKKYNFNSMTFELSLSVDSAWSAYVNSSPKDAWSGQNIQFDFAYSKPKNQVYYQDSELPPIHEGMGFYIILKIAGITKIPVGVEITRIDPIEKVFEYTYLMANASRGKQIVHFRTNYKGGTIIEHNTYFKSDSSVRDQLYPFFHESLVKEFHQNVMKLIGLKATRIQ